MSIAYRFGPQIEDGGVRFRLWAPDAKDIFLECEGSAPAPMHETGDGWKESFIACGAGTHYRFRMGDMAMPDPASRLQRGGIHGWSVVCAPKALPDSGWKGRPWSETVFYEIHAGLAGGFTGIAAKLDDLCALGFTAIEPMPIAAFPGHRNWGYDGVLPFAPAEAYGSPDSLRAMIAHAHARGISVFLDVVYNHFGPDGNYLSHYAKAFFRSDIQTPWGAAIDFRNETVRRFFTENALYWVHEFGIDGLRFDAVHAMRDEGFLDGLASELRDSLPVGKQLHLVVENEDNIASHLRRGFDAQWNDDIHHALHVLLTGEQRGYYQDYAEESAKKLARGLCEGFVYQGEPSPNHDGKPRGTKSVDLSPLSFVAFLQNHDQIGNRAFGERLTVLADEKTLKAAVALLLLCPQIPLVFMGEEIGSRTPFLYFTDHHGELAEVVRKGRQREFAAFAESTGKAPIPDPNEIETFHASTPQLDAPDAEKWRAHYSQLLKIRRERLFPGLSGSRATGAEAVGPKAVIARWRLNEGSTLTIACNLDSLAVTATLPKTAPIWGRTEKNEIPAAETIAWIEPAP